MNALHSYLKDGGSGLLSVHDSEDFIVAATKEDRVEVPLGNIQAEPCFVVRLIERAVVYLWKQFLNLAQARCCV